jgi:hypothetical protein
MAHQTVKVGIPLDIYIPYNEGVTRDGSERLTECRYR